MKKALRGWGRWFSRLLLVVVAALMIAAFLLPPIQGPGEIQAGSGYSIVFYGVNATMDDGTASRSASVGTCAWAQVRNGIGLSAADAAITITIQVYQDAGDCALKVVNLVRGQCAFDTSALPDDCFVSAVTLDLYLDTASGSTFSTIIPRVVVAPGSQQVAAPVAADYQENPADIALSASVPFPVGTPAGYQTFTFNQAGRDWISKTGITKFKIRDYVYDLLDTDPAYVTDGDGGIQSTAFKAVEAGTVYRPKLTVYYGDAPVERVPANPGNAAVGGSGHDVTAITWKTLRCAYSDEELGFRVAGAAGTAIQLRLVREDDTIIDQIDDTIRTDGYFFWGASCSTGDVGFVRCKELTHAKVSEWGYIATTPDATEIHNKTYAVFTDYPQYNRPFLSYIVDETTPMIIHWKTDIQATEQTDYSFRLYHLGDSGDTLFNQTFAWLCDNYYKNVYAANDKLAGVRYILFAAHLNGASSHDGLVIDLARPYISANQGFYQGLIYKNAAAEYSTTQTAHCYIKSLPGIVMATDTDNYDAGTPITLTIDIDDETGGLTMWDSYEVLNLRGADLGVGQGLAVQDAITGAITGSISVPGLMSGTVIADYTLRVRLYDSSPGCSYAYIHDVAYTVGGGKKEVEEDILDKISEWLEGLGLGGAAGKWLAIIIAMAIAFIITHKNKVLRVLLPLLVFGFGLVSGMLDIWVVVLLALGAGVAIFFIIRRGFGGGGEG